MLNFGDDPEIILEVRSQLESMDLNAALGRVNELIAQKEEVNTHALAIQLALTLAKELKTGEPLGKFSIPLVQTWTSLYPASIVDEAIGFSREFLFKPLELVNTLSERLFNIQKQKEQNDEFIPDDLLEDHPTDLYE